MKRLKQSVFIRRCFDFWNRYQLSPKRRRDIFEHIYRENHWRNEATRSGHGSSFEQTETIRSELPSLIARHDIRSLIDIACGDYYWMQQVDLKLEDYIGIDIVENLISRNVEKYGNPHRQFLRLDIVTSSLPRADLVFCRDLLVHFSVADIFKALTNIKKSGAIYLLTTTFPERQENADILTGDWRPLNLEGAPFAFPAPVQLINENCTEDAGAFRDKSLGLWKIADL